MCIYIYLQFFKLLTEFFYRYHYFFYAASFSCKPQSTLLFSRIVDLMVFCHLDNHPWKRQSIANIIYFFSNV